MPFLKFDRRHCGGPHQGPPLWRWYTGGQRSDRFIGVCQTLTCTKLLPGPRDCPQGHRINMCIISKEGIQDTHSGLAQAKGKKVMFMFSDRPKIFALTPNFLKLFCLRIDIWSESGYFSILKKGLNLF